MNTSSTKRIALVMEAWGPGGTETYVAGLIRTFLRHGIDFSLILLAGDAAAEVPGVPRERLIVAGLRGLPRALRRLRPSVVSLHLYTSLLPVVALCRMLGCRTVATLHIPLRDWGLRHRMYWRLATRQATMVAGVSRPIVDEFPAANTYPAPLPGGVSPLFFDCERALPAADQDFRIIAMGRLNQQKDWPTLIAAVGALPAPERARVLIDSYGAGPLRESLQAQARQQNVRMRFHGYVGKDALVRALREADLSVLPSRFEGLGLSALEGMAAGVPTITADFPAAADFIQPWVTGHTFPVGDAGALATLILWHMRDPERSRRLGRAGREFVHAHFSEEAAYTPYLALFDQVAAT